MGPQFFDGSASLAASSEFKSTCSVPQLQETTEALKWLWLMAEGETLFCSLACYNLYTISYTQTMTYMPIWAIGGAVLLCN